jgi:glycosyltransferase involved in cell wall biosynthesis
MTTPAVTVVIPCYGLGSYLGEAIDSVRTQTHADWELLVVDDGSSDEPTLEALRQAEHAGVTVLRTPHRGLAAARNAGLAAARAQYICFLDADDLLLPGYLSAAAAALDANAGLTFVSSWLETFGDEQWTWSPRDWGFPALLIECTVCTAALVRTEAVRAAGGFDETMPDQGYEDWDLWISLVERGHQGTILPEVFFRYRKRRGSMSERCCTGDTHLRLMEHLIRKHRQAFEAHATAILKRKDAETAALLRRNDDLAREIHTTLRPILEHQRAERDRLQRKMETVRGATAEREFLRQQIDALTRTLEDERRLTAAQQAALLAEIEALRTSGSWKVTAPLRALYRALGLHRR